MTAALSQIEDGAVVVSWWSTSTVLWYAQYVDGIRPDIMIIDDRTRLDLDYGEATDVIARFLGSRPVYVIRANDYDLGLVLALYELEPLTVGAGDERLPRGRRTRVRVVTGPAPARVPALSYFFPAHNEAANLRGLVEEALRDPARPWRRRSRSSSSTTAHATRRRRSRTSSPRPTRRVRAVHHPRNLGYGAALRTGFASARHDLIAFTDGDRQFRVADIGRLTARYAEGGAEAVVGYRIRRADPFVRTLYARAYRLANRIFFGLAVTDVDCACKLFRRDALRGISVESGGAFFSAELLIKLRAAGRTVVEVGVPHYPRTAGSPTGAKPRVILRAVRDFWALRLRLWPRRTGP